MSTISSKILVLLFAAWAVSLLGCARPQGPALTKSTTPRVLSPDAAAELAARLANNQCEQQYKKRPFAPQQHTAVLENGVYRWGGLDVGGAKGFSALVTFAQDGHQPQVEVYFSSDALTPP